MVETNLEIDQAVTALTAEILKLSPASGEARDALSVTIENALLRLALAILSQSNQSQEKAMEEAMPTAGAA